MFVIRVWEAERALVGLPVLYLGVVEVRSHLLDELGSLGLGLGFRHALLLGELVVLAVVQLIEDRAAPQRTVEVLDGQAQQEVPLLAGP
jgi:hypothetical protein